LNDVVCILIKRREKGLSHPCLIVFKGQRTPKSVFCFFCFLGFVRRGFICTHEKYVCGRCGCVRVDVCKDFYSLFSGMCVWVLCVCVCGVCVWIREQSIQTTEDKTTLLV